LNLHSRSRDLPLSRLYSATWQVKHLRRKISFHEPGELADIGPLLEPLDRSDELADARATLRRILA
jgi:hypothetical protein